MKRTFFPVLFGAMLMFALALPVGAAMYPAEIPSQATEGYMTRSPLIDSVESEFQKNPDLATPDMVVESKDNTIRLSGWVHDSIARQKAEDTARKVDGVGHVINDLKVRGPSERRDTR